MTKSSAGVFFSRSKLRRASDNQGPDLPQTHTKLGLLASQRSLSADSISCFRQNFEHPSRFSSPQLTASHNTLPYQYSRAHFQQLLLSFVAGVFVTFAVVAWLSHIRPGSPWSKYPLHTQTPELCPTLKAPGVSLTPLALSRATGNSSATTDRLIVAVRYNEDTSWLDVYLSDVPHIVYQAEDPDQTEGAQHATMANKGDEAMAYMQFIIDYYERLPTSIVFLHGHRSAWHMDDHVPLLRRIRWGQVPFANLRFATGPDHHLKWRCELGARQNGTNKFDCDWVGNHLRPGTYEIRKNSAIHIGNKDEWWDSTEMAQVWNQTYLQELGPPPPELHAPCCAEFIVARERILRHPLAFYKHLRDWIIDTELDRYRSGRVFEYMWHYIFGEPAVIDPIPECDLLFCDGGTSSSPTQALDKSSAASSQ